MAKDHSLSARKGIVARLRGVSEITSIVGIRIYGEKVPANPVYPFIRVGLMIPTPYSPSCVDGMDADFNIDCNSTQADAGEAYALSAAVVDALHTKSFALADDAHVASLRWRGTTPRQENKVWRNMVRLSMTTQATSL